MIKHLSAVAFAAVITLAGAALAASPTFEDLDTNDDGVLSKAEAADAAGLDFAVADTNKDGMLNKAEYEAAAH